MAETYSFQCKKCGALIPTDHTRDHETVPSICYICKGGVRISENPHGGGQIVIPEPDNWIVLSELKGGELTNDPKRKDLKPEQVTRHVVKTSHDHPRRKAVDPN